MRKKRSFPAFYFHSFCGGSLFYRLKLSPLTALYLSLLFRAEPLLKMREYARLMERENESYTGISEPAVKPQYSLGIGDVDKGGGEQF